ncbi:MAG: aldo/keto reductase [Hyphomicrobiales bacterium]|nr:MAG: aldo/keto reductase [Hyphomicrobiales bacterium]
MPGFKLRQVGRTSLQVTELGLGAATLVGAGGTVVPPDQARATVSAALDAGIGYIDTAPHYGCGRSEHLTGDALRFRPEPFVISTKVGRLMKPVRSDADRTVPHGWTQPFPFEMVYDYAYDGVMRSFEDSLQRLGLGKIDILLVHDIGTQTHGELHEKHWADLANGGYRALTELRSQGLVSAIGLGVNEWPILMDALELGDWDVFLLANRYTLLEQTPLEPLMSACLKRGTSMIAAGPFAAGILAGSDIWGPANGVYQKAPPEVLERVGALQAVCRDFNVLLPAAALHFALAHPVVCNVVTGPKSPAELNGIIEWWNSPIPAGFWDALADQKLVAPGTPLPGGRIAG